MLAPTVLLPLFIMASIFTTPALSQTRNLVYPNSTAAAVATSINPASTSAATPAAHANGTATATNATTVSNTTGTGTAASAHPTTSTVPLTKIPDSTGVNNVPVPLMTGQRANGRYGPDDGYIAAVSQLIIPVSLAVSVMAATMFVVGFGL